MFTVLLHLGKTTYLEQTKTKFTKGYTGLRPNKVTTTVGLNIGKIDIQGVRINFWDLGGQESLQVNKVLQPYFRTVALICR